MEAMREALADRGIDVVADAGKDTLLARWEPGNGTRYQVLVQYLEGELAKAVVQQEEGVVVTWLNPVDGKVRAFTVGGRGAIQHPLVVMAGLRVGGEDLTYLAILVNTFAGDLSYAAELHCRLKLTKSA